MEFFVYLLLYMMPSIVEGASDPLDGWAPSAAALRDLDCEVTTVERARRERPGEVDEASPRGDRLERRAVICRERLMPTGARRARDDAVLFDLRETAPEMVALVDALEPALRTRTWLVEVFHPEVAVGQKISFAVKNALLDRGLRASDRAPALAAGDIEVIGAVEPARAYPLACTRYAAAGSLRPDDALMAVVLRDPRETMLHVGVCADGRWRWLR